MAIFFLVRHFVLNFLYLPMFQWTSKNAYLCICVLFFYQTPSNIPTPDQKFVPFINTDYPFTHQLPKSHDQGHANPEEIKMRSRQFDSFLIFWAVNQIKSAEMSKISAIVKYFSRGSAFVKDFVFYNQTTKTGINMCFCFLKSATKILWKKWYWGCCLLICWWRALFSFSRLSQLVLQLLVWAAVSCWADNFGKSNWRQELHLQV